jgi:phage shock protein PspC (stress-responsive transcriptional regulator)
MKLSETGMQRLLRISSALIVLGLAVEIVSLFRFHPLSFALFAFVATALIGVGILVYLVSLLFITAKPTTESGG